MNISRSYVRKQIANVPSDNWLMTHTPDRSAYMDPRIAYIFDGLDYDRILRLVVGHRWQAIHPSNWPRLIRKNTEMYRAPIDIRDTDAIDSGLSKVREWWEKVGKYINPYYEALRRDRGY